MIINVDFDGTCVTHEYHQIGKSIGAEPILRELTKRDHLLILFTMRSGKELQDAVSWFNENNIPLYGINTNPTQLRWTTSPKSYADYMIDDSAIGTPLTKRPLEFNREDFLEKYGDSPFLSPTQLNGKCYYEVARPYVDWEKMTELLIKLKLL